MANCARVTVYLDYALDVYVSLNMHYPYTVDNQARFVQLGNKNVWNDVLDFGTHFQICLEVMIAIVGWVIANRSSCPNLSSVHPLYIITMHV